MRTKFTNEARVVCSDYAAYLSNCGEKFDIILLDPPYAEVFLEKALKLITEIDILQSGGIIVTERPLEK
jgi:16S rRNA G966 N2-methylase RsmD